MSQILVQNLPIDFLSELGAAFSDLPFVQGVFLSGSAATGELLWSRGENGDSLVSDVEFGVVVDQVSPEYRSALGIAAAVLGRKWDYELEPFMVSKRRLANGSPKNLSFRTHTPNLLMFDIYSSGKWIYSQATVKPTSPWTDNRFPAWEAIRLILNRIGESLLHFLPSTDNQPATVSIERVRWVNKILLAIGDACLIADDLYISKYGERALRFSSSPTSRLLSPTMQAAICHAYEVRAGIENIDVTHSVSVHLLMDESAMILDNLLDFSPGDVGPRDSNEWVRAVRKLPVSVLYQAPVAWLDRPYDGLITAAYGGFNIRNGKDYLKGLALGVPLQVFAYGQIYLITKRLASSAPLNRIEIDLAISAQERWNEICK